ncbi:Clp protease N-terminal domain-containing protein [Frankia sp. AgB1.9]|uniref:Clp protease N-terminal domain-containing protein n=1 Tax=unclassified Frankia TaxID=2632575 RepID=UPI00193481D4|nr:MULTISPECIES: Clp protease N-terminal domain-containing protein [unclassified Frankia]MBL7490796.1 Clp protease N-terminal domain-containing protein [Frankia sp. AgW1.1]MBL7552247.1 Clp protease N-terminal domain-containing protein [Frankia sp. AgB1.9]MBL7621994.1 Clp protease N-terminal domain-containing protein [Frankia sp. AgB1.8]
MSRPNARGGAGPRTYLARPIGPVLTAAREEAGQARHGYVGVEHLLIALTREQTGSTSRLLAEHSVTYPRTRDAVWLVVGSGRGDGPRWDAGTLLATLGIDLDEIRRQVDARFGPDPIHRLYTSEVGWNLRPRGPLCEPPLTPQLKRTLDNTLGRCWDATPPQLHQRLLLATLDAQSTGLGRVLDELDVSLPLLRAAVATHLPIAS